VPSNPSREPTGLARGAHRTPARSTSLRLRRRQSERLSPPLRPAKPCERRSQDVRRRPGGCSKPCPRILQSEPGVDFVCSRAGTASAWPRTVRTAGVPPGKARRRSIAPGPGTGRPVVACGRTPMSRGRRRNRRNCSSDRRQERTRGGLVRELRRGAARRCASFSSAAVGNDCGRSANRAIAGLIAWRCEALPLAGCPALALRRLQPARSRIDT